MRVLHVAAEAVPYAKVGGLADVAGSLPGALRAAGVDAHLAIPPHRGVRVGDADATVHLVGPAPAFDRPAIYGEMDDGARYLGFAQAAAALARRIGADLVHAHDWHAAAAVTASGAPPTIVTIHNLAYQGEQPPSFAGAHGLPVPPAPGDRWDGEVNLLGRGLAAAAAITTVSPTYAREITTAEHGCGLEPLLAARGVVGIVNGIDDASFDPARDPVLAAPFSAADRTGRAACRDALAAVLGLAGDGPIVGVVARLVHQKGLDLLLAAAPALLAAGGRLAILGTGERALEDGFAALAAAHPGRVAMRIGFDDVLARRIYAGADAFCMPSRFEPCGLGQLIAMRYGAVPVVRRTGGLADTVDPSRGFLFDDAEPAALAAALAAMASAYADTARWDRLVATALAADHSWAPSARRYAELYREVLGS